MASFLLTSYSPTAQTLVGGETGVLTNSDAELVVGSGVAITTGGTSRNYLSINGSVLTTSGFHPAASLGGTSAEVSIGPTGYVNAFGADTIDTRVSDSLFFRNAGTILSGRDAMIFAASDSAATFSLANSGTVIGYSDAITVNTGSAASFMSNSGTIIAETGIAIWANWLGPGSTGSSHLFNTGLIQGADGAYTAFTGLGVNVINNAGVMVGDVRLGANADRYEGGSGRVSGTVYGEADNDTLAGGALTDVLDGGSGADQLVGRGGDDVLTGADGNDYLIGGSGNDRLSGGGNNDTLVGNGEDDSLSGDAGNDLLVGQDGSDELDGGADNDTLDGGNGDDLLEGGTGNDILRGRSGDDDLAGGEGFDLLTGGQGADSFVFRGLSETAPGALRDQILDFERGLDLIVVAGLSPGVFEFRGTAPFAPSGNPELRLSETPTGSTIVQVDADGNGSVDAEIRVANVTGLTAEDFVL